MNYEKTKEMYNDIFSCLEKYKDDCDFNIDDLKRKSKLHLYMLELVEKYGLNLGSRKLTNLDYNRFGEFMSIGMFGKEYSRTISWEDNGKEPNNEMLLVISFSSGPYLFGSDYPKELFKQFFYELKTYNPKYCDSQNSNLYFSMDNAKNIFNEFDVILKKYLDLNKEDYKLRKIKKLEEELKKLNQQ